MILLAFVVLAWCASGVLLALTLRLLRPVEHLLAALLLSLAGASATTLAVGLLGGVSVWPLVATAGVSLLVSVAFARSPSRRPRVVQTASMVRASARTTMSELRRSPFTLILVGLAAAAVLFHLFLAVRLPVGDYDGLSYHLLRVDTWVDEGAIVHTPRSGLDGTFPIQADGAPAGAALLTVLVSAIPGHAGLADAVQIPFALLGALAVVLVCRTLRVSRPHSVAAGALFLLTPAVLAQLNTSYVDVALGGAALAAFAWLAVAADPARSVGARGAPIALAGIALGLAVGIKATGLGWLVAAVVVVAGLIWGSGDPKLVRRWLVALLVPVLLLGSFWYVRNLVTYGNPTHPYDFGAGPLVLVHGVLPADALPEAAALGFEGAGRPERVVRSWFSEPGPVAYDERLGGLGLVWPWVMVPCLAVAAVRLGRDRRRPAAVFALGVLLPLAIQPFPWWARFALPAAGVGAVAVVVVLEQVRRQWVMKALAASVVGAVVVSTWTAHRTLTFDGAPIPISRVLEVAAGPAEERRLGDLGWEQHRPLQDVPGGATVAVLDGQPVLVHAVVGDELERQVVTFGGIAEVDGGELAAAMDRLGADHLYVPEGTVEDVSAAGAPERFEQVGAAGGWVVWARQVDA
jgi:hypothetical protein